MNVRLTPHRYPQRTVMFSGVGQVLSDGTYLTLAPAPPRLTFRGQPVTWDPIPPIPLRLIAEIALDEDGADP